MLTDILPPEIRRVLYVVYAVGVLILGAVGLVLAGLDLTSVYYDVAVSVWLYLGAGVGAVAAGNITPAAPGRHAAE